MRRRELEPVRFYSFSEPKSETRDPKMKRRIARQLPLQRGINDFFIWPSQVHEPMGLKLTDGVTTDVGARIKSFLNRDLDTRSFSQLANVLPDWIDALPASPKDILDALLECTVEGNTRARMFALQEVARFSRRHSLKDDRVMFRLLAACREDLRDVARKELTCLIRSGAKGDAKIVDALLAGCHANQHPNTKTVALKLLEEVMQANVAKCVEISGPVPGGSKDGEKGMRERESRQLAYFAKAGPGITHEIFKDLLKTCRARESSVRRQAMSQLTKLVDLLREQCLEASAVLLEGCRNQMDDKVILIALQCMMQSNTVWRQNSNEMTALLLRVADRTEDGLCEEAVELAGKMIERRSGDPWDLVTVVMRGSRRHVDVKAQHNGVKYLVQAAKACPSRARPILELLQERADYSFLEKTKVLAISQLGAMVALWPEEFPEVVQDLLEASAHPHSGMRTAAMSQLGMLSKLYPERSREILEIVLQGCNDACKDVRAAAVGQTATLANLCPEWAEIIFDIVFRSCRSTHAATRENALSELGQIVDILPTKAKQAAVVVFRGCADTQPGVSAAAKKHLEKLLRACPDLTVDILAKAEENPSSERSHM